MGEKFSLSRSGKFTDFVRAEGVVQNIQTEQKWRTNLRLEATA